MDKAAIRFTADLSKHYKPLRKTCNCSEDSLHLESFSSYLCHLRTSCESSQKGARVPPDGTVRRTGYPEVEADCQRAPRFVGGRTKKPSDSQV